MELVYLHSPIAGTYDCLRFRKAPTVEFALSGELWLRTIKPAFRLNKELHALRPLTEANTWMSV